ncbi:hypothetical protein DPEC_G00027720 [Dallia pectoralis]|uniref:Uncharacterized protein n=1 Tax=Dallia pectoralis TaxID=75939 RepID=A0ACC2HJD3_DALPE|nr:hypothetical protein DPEC_G00027720 [Dallia pectoralis]
MLSVSTPTQNPPGGEDSSESDRGSEVGVPPPATETDRFGFILGNGSTAGLNREPCSYMPFSLLATAVHQIQLTLLLAAAVGTAQLPDPTFSLSNERTSIERTYELTIYLEHQLREIKRTYLSYLGPPFSDPDFSPPRPNSTALSLPSAATRLELWRGLENRARLAQNQRAYAVLLEAVRELAHSTLCPYLQTSLLHFSTGLDGLLGSISGLMSTLGYAQSLAGGEAQYPLKDTGGARGAAGRRPASIISHSLYETKTGAGPRPRLLRDQRGATTTREGKAEIPRREMTERKWDREKDRERGRVGRRAEVTGAAVRSVGSRQEERGERGRKGRKKGADDWEETRDDREEEEELEREGGRERWGRRRRLLSISEEGEMQDQQTGVILTFSSNQHVLNNNHDNNPDINNKHDQKNNKKNNHENDNDNKHNHINKHDHNYNHDNKLFSYTVHYHPQLQGGAREGVPEEDRYYIRESSSLLSSSPSLHLARRSPRSLIAPTIHPPLSLFYPFGTGEGHTLLSEPVPLSLRRAPPLLPPPPLPPLLAPLSSSSLLAVRPALNDFSRKVEGFWVLRELQSWLWRSAKDFTRLKKRLRV